MSNLDPALTSTFFEATQRYEDLRHDALVRKLGETTLLAALDHEEMDLSAALALSNEEYELYRSQQEEIENEGRPDTPDLKVALASLAFDKEAEKIFGELDGYTLGYVASGSLKLIRMTEELGLIDLVAGMNDEGQVIASKASRRLEQGLRSQPLPLSPEDIAILAKSIEQLQLTNSLLASTTENK